MAKYCTNCGKKLEEGQVCDCKKDSIVNNETSQKALDLVRGMIYTPIDTIKDFTKKSSFNMAMILVCALSIITGLFTMSIVKNGSNYTMQLAYSGLGSSGLESIMPRSMEIPYMKIFFTSLVLVFGLSFVYTGLLYLVNTVIFKREADFKEVYSMYGACSIISSLGVLASTILMFVNVTLGLIMFALTSILNVVYSYHGLKFLGTKDENKYGYIYLLTNVLFYVVIFIISKIFS